MEPKTKEEILAIYKRRTDFLVNSDKSPVPLEVRRRGFKGLEYYPIDKRYQFKLKLQKYDYPGTIQIALSNGEHEEALRVGFLEFEIENKRLALQVYKKRREDTELFVPFKDKTSGNETYGGGRYTDVEYDPGDDTCILDFNLSGNPLCAFADGRYDCPIPPREKLGLMLRFGRERRSSRISQRRPS
jgi:uncharacterized protein